MHDQDLGEDLLEYLQGFKQLMFDSYKAWGRPVAVLCDQVFLDVIERFCCPSTRSCSECFGIVLFCCVLEVVCSLGLSLMLRTDHDVLVQLSDEYKQFEEERRIFGMGSRYSATAAVPSTGATSAGETRLDEFVIG